MTEYSSANFTFLKYDSGSSSIQDMGKKKETHEEMEHIAEKLKTLGMVASGVAHDLNGPLATMKACSDGLLNRLDNNKFDPSLFKTYLEIIEEEIERCIFITNNVLRYLRNSEKANDNLVDIHASLDRTVDMFKLQGRCDKIEIIRQYEKSLLSVSGNEFEVRQVFLSIIDNALDVMNEGDRLTLKTGKDNNQVFVSINNTGTLIPGEYIKNIFNPYFTTKSDRGGTGLGLFLANKIIKERGGNISVNSNEQTGTTFIITLPS